MGSEGVEVIHKGGPLTVTRSEQFGRAVWRFEGECSAQTQNLKGLLDSMADRASVEEAPVLIDLRAATYVSSPFIGFLVRLVARLADRDRRLELWGPSERIVDLLTIVGIEKSLTIHAAEEPPPEAAAAAGSDG